MARLPIPGNDVGKWGEILNNFLRVSLKSDGTLKKAADIEQAKADAIAALASLDDKVDKVVGKSLSSNDFSDSEKSKLNTIAVGAEINAVDSVNTKTGTVVLDADDISDSSTTNKFVTAADITKLSNTSGTNTGDQTLAGLGGVPNTRTVNGHALSADVTVSKSDVGLGSVDNTSDTSKNVLSASKLTTARDINGVSFDGTTDIIVADNTKVPTTRTVNGHALSADVTVTKSDVGLGNVDNTTDLNKPISTATQSALDAKLDDSQLDTDGTLAANSDTRVASQKATKAYVDANTRVPIGLVPNINEWPDLPGRIITGSQANTNVSAGSVTGTVFFLKNRRKLIGVCKSIVSPTNDSVNLAYVGIYNWDQPTQQGALITQLTTVSLNRTDNRYMSPVNLVLEPGSYCLGITTPVALTLGGKVIYDSIHGWQSHGEVFNVSTRQRLFPYKNGLGALDSCAPTISTTNNDNLYGNSCRAVLIPVFSSP